MSFFSRLKAIAGVKNGVDGNLVKTEKPFICPSDGHYGDPNDCTKLYKCAHGTPVIEYCPATLFWNQGETPSFSNSNSKHLCSYGENLELYHLVEKYDVLYYSSLQVSIPLKIAQITFLHTFCAFPGLFHFEIHSPKKNHLEEVQKTLSFLSRMVHKRHLGVW